MRYRIAALCCTLAPSLSIFSQPASAQPATRDTLKTYQADSVVVMATRSPEMLINVPMAASYVPAQAYAYGRGYELKDALRFVPGVLTQARSGHTDLRITIRGYGARGAANRSNAGNMRGIRVLIDGIPETEPDGRTSLDLVHLDATSHVEVLRSNASTLYGSASGGVINLGTNLEFPSSFVATRNTAGSFNFLHNTVEAGAVVGSSHIFAAVSNTTYGDAEHRAYREHSGSSQLLGTLGVLSKLAPQTSLGVYASATSNLFRFPGPLTRAQFDSSISQANADFVKRDERRFNRQGRFAATLDHGFDESHRVFGTVFLQPKVLERSERNTYRDFNRYGIGAQARYEWTADFSSSIGSRFSAGIDEQYQDGTVLFYSITPSGSRGDTLQQNKQEGANTIGGYVEETITLDDQWMLKLGGRYDRVTYTFRNFMKLEPPTGRQEKIFSQFTPKGSLSYRYMPGHMAYVTVGGGVEAPAFNEVDPPSDSLVIARGGTPDKVNADFNPVLDPATSTSYELGARGVITPGEFIPTLRYDVAGYLIMINNDLVPWDGGRYYFTAAKTQRIGVELGLSMETSIGLTVNGALTVGQSKYLEYENQLGKFDGNMTAGLPTTYGSLGLRYDAPLGLFVEGTVDYVGSYFADDRNDKKTDGTPDPSINSEAPAYMLLGATAGWSHNFGGLGLDLFAGIHNLADTKYVSSVFINGERNQYFEPGMPRNVVVGVQVRYQ